MTTTDTRNTDAPIPAREQAFAAWLRLAIDAIVPADGSPIRCDAVTGGRIFNRDPVPRGLTTGDVLRGMMRMVDEGVIEWCGVEGPTSVRRRVAPTLDASRLRTIADSGIKRIAHKTLEWRGALAIKMRTDGTPIERLASMSAMAALAEAREEGYRAAVADLLGALPHV